MQGLLTGVAEGMGHGLSQPVTESEQTGAGGDVHGRQGDGLSKLAPAQREANR